MPNHYCFTLQTESGASSIWHMHSEWMIKNHRHQNQHQQQGSIQEDIELFPRRNDGAQLFHGGLPLKSTQTRISRIIHHSRVVTLSLPLFIIYSRSSPLQQPLNPDSCLLSGEKPTCPRNFISYTIATWFNPSLPRSAFRRLCTTKPIIGRFFQFKDLQLSI